MKPDIVTDQTSAHDIVNGYVPIGWSVAQWQAAQQDPAQHTTRHLPEHLLPTFCGSAIG